MPTKADDKANVDSFLKAVLRSGLLSQIELQSVLLTIPKDQQADPQALARHLIKIGKLSWFQAQKLIKGAASGLLMEPYEVVAPIGKGGMGMVYLARDRRNNRLVALKILPPKRAKAEERMLARFQREMEISQRVSHPHIAETFETGEFQGVYFIAMEYIPGKTLYRLVLDHGPLSVPLAAKVFSEIATGLEYAHGQGVIHRDLKPSNIMVTPNGHGKVLDLGLALIEGELHHPKEIIGGQGYIVGSMDYIAPEQTKDAVKVDARADIYGLGCTLFFALSGTPPFPGGDAKEKIQRHRRETPTSLLRLNSTIPGRFNAVIEKMMAKDPEDRYPSAKDVAETLQEWAADEPALPLDEQGDLSFQEAVKALKEESVESELVEQSILMGQKNEPASKLKLPSFLSELIPPIDDQNRMYFWVCVGIVGFWILILLLLGIVLIFR